MNIRAALRLSPEAFWVLLGQIGTAALSLLGVKLLTTLLLPEEYGLLALATTIVTLISTNLVGAFGQSFLRFWSIKVSHGAEYEFYSFLESFIRVLLEAFTILLVAVTICAGIGRLSNPSTGLFPLSAASGLLFGIINIRLYMFFAGRYRKDASALEISTTLLKYLVPGIFLLLFEKTATTATLGLMFAGLAGVWVAGHMYKGRFPEAAAVIKTRSIRSFLLKGIEHRDMFHMAGIFIIWGLLSWAKVACDRWALQYYFGAAVVGTFSVVSQVSLYIVSFGSAFFTTLFNPIAFQQAGGLGESAGLRKANKTLFFMLKVFSFAMIAVVLVSVFLKGIFVRLISNQSYVKYAELLPWLIAVQAVYSVGEMTTAFGVLKKRMQLFIIPKIISTGIIVGLVFLLAHVQGPRGIVVALGIGSLIYSIWTIKIAIHLSQLD